MTVAESTSFGYDIEQEFNRFVAGLRSVTARTSTAGKDRSDSGHRGDQASITAQSICEYALELVAREGAEALTVRRLAGDLGISTRTFYKRIGSRSNMIQELIDMYCARLNLEIDLRETWDDTVWSWCLRLHRVLTVDPHLTLLSQERIPAAVESSLGVLVAAAVVEGVPKAVAREYCQSFTAVTVTDAIATARKALDDTGEECATRRGLGPSDRAVTAITWILRVRTESESTCGWSS